MNLRFDNITFAYPNNVILNNLSVRFASGELVCVLGRNGSGKTTLMQLISGRLLATSGEIRSSESSQLLSHNKSLRHYFAILPQGIQDPPYLTVYEILELAQFRPEYRHPWKLGVTDNEPILNAISSCEIGDFVSRDFGQLSGGEKQRVWLAFCLIQNKPFMLLDESLHALDFIAKERAFLMLSTLAREGTGIILSTHDLALAEKYADRIIYLENGGLLHDGPADIDLKKLVQSNS